MNRTFHKLAFIVAAMFLLVVGNNDWLVAQEADSPKNNGPEVEQQSQEEIDQALENILKNLPKMEDDDEKSGKQNKPEPPTNPPTASDKEGQNKSDEDDKDDDDEDPGIVVELQKQLDALKAKNQESSKKDLVGVKRLASQLKIAKSIEQQFKKAPIQKSARKESDSFVVANLEVKPKSDELEVSFQSTQGEKASVRQMFEFVTGTPADGYRDFRIISRHNDSNVELALNGVRREYDMAKEREKQFLQYVQQQQAHMARIKAARRC